jgi:hypothetical protein
LLQQRHLPSASACWDRRHAQTNGACHRYPCQISFPAR